MEIDDKLAELETMVENKAIESEEVKVEEILENVEETQDNANNEPKQPNNALAIKDMSFNDVTEMAKKSNLVATANDKNFVAELSEQNKDVLKASIALEREKVEAENLRIKLEQEKLATEKEKNLNERLKDRFGSKLDAQEYHYKSLQPILETFGIKKPMNVYVMWIIAVLGCITLLYPIKLLFCATFGNLIAGASSENRKGFAKGCMWTAIAILGVAFIALIIFGITKLGLYLF